MMKERRNIQVIDEMPNSAYDIFSCSDDDFVKVFPDNINIQFIEDIGDDNPGSEINTVLSRLWSNPVRKQDVNGIHGTLFYGLLQVKKKFYPNKRESDLDHKGRAWRHGDP